MPGMPGIIAMLEPICFVDTKILTLPVGRPLML